MAGLVVEMLFMLFSVCNWLKISEYKVYWLMDFPPIILLGVRQEIIMVTLQTNKYKENEQFYSQKGHSYKK